MNLYLTLAVVVLLGAVLSLCALVVILVTLLRATKEELAQAETKARTEALEQANLLMKQKEKEIRQDAIARSKKTVRGQVFEQLVPFELDFPFNPKDCHFLGSPIDFIVFDGLYEDTLDRIVLLEIKSGLSPLSRRQIQVKQVIDEGQVQFQVYRRKIND